MPTRRLALLAAAAALAAALAGCTASPGGSAQTPSMTATASASADAAADGAADAGIDPDDPPKALASTTYSPGGSDGIDSVLIEVVGMRHVKKALVVTFRFTAKGDSSEPKSIYKTLGENIFYPSMIDYDNLKKYDFAPGTKTDEVYVEAPVGEPMYASAAFAYPEGADSVDILVGTNVTPIEGVPVP